MSINYYDFIHRCSDNNADDLCRMLGIGRHIVNTFPQGEHAKKLYFWLQERSLLNELPEAIRKMNMTYLFYNDNNKSKINKVYAITDYITEIVKLSENERKIIVDDFIVDIDLTKKSTDLDLLKILMYLSSIDQDWIEYIQSFKFVSVQEEHNK